MSTQQGLQRLRTTIFLCASAASILVFQDHSQIANCQQTSTVDGGISKESILNWLEGKKRDRNKFNEYTLISRIGKEGISFRPTEGDKDEFRKSGASEKLITAIETAKIHLAQSETRPPKPIPPPHKTGKLTVTCQPAECQFSVNGATAITTRDGVWSLPLDEGSATVSATKDDYEPDQKEKVVDIVEGKPAHVEFTFKVSNAALAKAGRRLFEQMMGALGWTAGLKTSQTVFGKGTLKSYSEGKITEWDLVALIELPNKGKFNVSGRGQKLEVTRTESGFEWKKSHQPSGIGELEACLRLLQDYQIAMTVGRLQGPGFTIVADQLKPTDGQPVVLRAIGGSETYKITLDPEFRPREIALESTGLDSGLRIMYSEYAAEKNTAYPKHMQVILPDAARHGVEVQFSQIDLGPAEMAPGKKKAAPSGQKE